MPLINIHYIFKNIAVDINRNATYLEIKLHKFQRKKKVIPPSSALSGERIFWTKILQMSIPVTQVDALG